MPAKKRAARPSLLNIDAIKEAAKTPEGIKALLSNKADCEILLSVAEARETFIKELENGPLRQAEIQTVLDRVVRFMTPPWRIKTSRK